jgi:hypothetical protein
MTKCLVTSLSPVFLACAAVAFPQVAVAKARERQLAAAGP